MTVDQEACSLKVIEFCRTHNRKLAGEYAKMGMQRDDIAIGALYAAFDLALAFTGDPIAAIEWLRTGIDVQEQTIMERETLQ